MRATRGTRCWRIDRTFASSLSGAIGVVAQVGKELDANQEKNGGHKLTTANHNIYFDKVRYSYDEKEVLKDICLTIEKKHYVIS